MNQTTVYLIDDDASFLRATERLLRASGFYVQAFMAARDFLAQLDAASQGCVVADLEMPGLSGFDLQAALAAAGNPLPILFLTGRGDIQSSVRAMREGAEDFLEKRAPKEALLDAIQRALWRAAKEREMREARQELEARFKRLTAREVEILGHVLRGRLNKQIAADLGINERTVKLHRAAIMAKVEASSVAMLALLARDAGVRGSRVSNPPGVH